MEHLTRRSILASTGATLLAAAATRPRQGLAASGDGPIRLMGNENPYGPSPRAAEAMSKNIGRAWQYVFSEERRLASMIAERENVSPENVMITAGSAEALRISALMACANGGELLAATPTFPFLQLYARRLGATIKEVPLDSGMVHNLEAMAENISADTRLVYVCNPNNPTGTVLPADELSRFIEAIPADVLTVVDEAYVDLLDDPQGASMVKLARSEKQILLTRTFSKIHGLAGLRVGFVIAPPSVIKRAKAFRMSMANVVSINAAIASYEDVEFQAFSIGKIRQAREVLYGFCRQNALAFTASKGNFVLVRTGRVSEFREFLRGRQILVGGSYAGYEDWCRISLGTVEHMQHFSKVAGEFFV
ncbi:MAG: histidinol-phosphate transaminase [Gammaproteobacteria bacterium]